MEEKGVAVLSLFVILSMNVIDISLRSQENMSALGEKGQKMSSFKKSTCHVSFCDKRSKKQREGYDYLANQNSIILQSFSRLLQLHQEQRDGWRDWMEQRKMLLV